MKKSILVLSLMTAGLFFTACRDEKPKTVIKEKTIETKEPAKAEPKEESKGILERAGEKVDGKVNKEVDDKIDEIDD